MLFESYGIIGGVTALAWTLVGLLAIALGVLAAALFYAITRIDAFRAGVGADIREVCDAVRSLEITLTRARG